MKTYFRFEICSFIIFAVLLFGCSTESISSLNNKLEIKTSPSLTPPNTPQNYEAKFIREEGWKIPMPERAKKMRIIEREVKSENGKMVKRTLTIYNPIGEFSFQRESSTSSSGIQIPSESLELESIWEIKINGKIYSYTVVARKAKLNEQTDNSVLTRHAFPYRYFDTDGDGKFETLVTDDSNILVPSWASQ